MNMKEIIQKAEKFALEEIEKYGEPPKFLFVEAAKYAARLADEMDIDKGIVSVGVWLMDAKLPQALKEKKQTDHVKMSSEASKEFLSGFDLPKEKVEKIINCVEGHHKDVPWTCKEAEVVANADCYKFLVVKNWLSFLHSLGERKMPFQDALKYAEQKADEKWKILSLDICKKELEPQYKLIKEIVAAGK